CAAGTGATPPTTSRWWGCSRGDSGQCSLGRGWIDPPRERIELGLETIDACPEVLHLRPQRVGLLALHQLIQAFLDSTQALLEPMQRVADIAVAGFQGFEPLLHAVEPLLHAASACLDGAPPQATKAAGPTGSDRTRA